MRKMAALVVAALSLSGRALAYEMVGAAALAKDDVASKQTDQQLDEIVVTASRTEKELQVAPAKSDVVKRSDIQSHNVKSIDESVKHVAGVYDRRSKGFGDTLASITLHGIPDQKRTLLMMDGVVLNNGYYGGAKLGGFSPEDVERIEIVQGPSSSLYGGFAMGGVVNVFTRMPEKQEFTAKVTRGEPCRSGDGNDNYNRYYFSYGNKFFDKLSIFVGTDRKSTDGFATDLNVQSKSPTGLSGYAITTDKSGNSPRYVIGDKGNNQWWEQEISGRIQYEFSDDSKLRLGYKRSRYEYNYGVPNTYLTNAGGSPVYSYSTVKENSYINGDGGKDQDLYSLNFDTTIDRVKVKLSMGLNREITNWYITPGSTASTTLAGGPGKLSDSPNHNFTTDLQFSFPLGTMQLLTVGGNFKNSESKSKDKNLSDWRNEKSTTGTVVYTSGGKDSLYGLYLQDEVAVTEKLTTYLGIRGDWWKAYDGEVNSYGTGGYSISYNKSRDSTYSPKLAIVYRPFEATVLKASAGKAFRAPTLYDLYRTWGSSTGTIYNSNPDLKPETVKSWDAGITQGLWNGAEFGVSYFENYMDDLIYTVKLTDTQSKYTNLGKAETKGYILEASQKVSDWLKLYANCTLLSKNEVTRSSFKPEIVGQHLTQQPMRIANAGIEAYYKGLDATFDWRHVSKRFGQDDNFDSADSRTYTIYGAYSVADAKFSYTYKDMTTFSVAVDNVFNRQYFDYYQAPGRTWYAEVGLKF